MAPEAGYTPQQIEAMKAEAQLLEALYHDPRTRGPLLQMIKHKSPGTPIPELDAPAQIHAALAPKLKEIDELKTELRKDKAQKEFEQERSRAREIVGEEALPAVEKLMQDKMIGDWETAARHYRMTQETASPGRRGPTPVTRPAYEGLLKDRRNWARQEAYKAVEEIERQRR